MMTRSVPSSGTQIPDIGFGTWQTFGASDKAESPSRLAFPVKFVALGGSVIDSSPMYGSSESVAGDLVAQLGFRDLVRRDQGGDDGQHCPTAADAGVSDTAHQRAGAALAVNGKSCDQGCANVQPASDAQRPDLVTGGIMGLLSGLMGNASEIDASKVKASSRKC